LFDASFHGTISFDEMDSDIGRYLEGGDDEEEDWGAQVRQEDNYWGP